MDKDISNYYNIHLDSDLCMTIVCGWCNFTISDIIEL